MHDQNFKNLILDYPVASLEFFAGSEVWPDIAQARIIPLRQEQLKERLGDRFRELDTPLLVEWPDGRRRAVLFVIEEETKTSEFSIHRLAKYSLDMAELMKTDRVVPVVIFLRFGNHPCNLKLGSDTETYLDFHYLSCDLWRIPATQYFDSGNIVARLNLPNMAYVQEKRLDMYRAALTGLENLETNPEKQKKYADFIDFYADLSDDEVTRYRMRYIGKEEENMGLAKILREEGRQEGRQEGRTEGRTEGFDEGIQEGVQKSVQALIESLCVLIDFKFGFDGARIYPQLMGIKDIQKLKLLLLVIKQAKTPDDVLNFMNEKFVTI